MTREDQTKAMLRLRSYGWTKVRRVEGDHAVSAYFDDDQMGHRATWCVSALLAHFADNNRLATEGCPDHPNGYGE